MAKDETITISGGRQQSVTKDDVLAVSGGRTVTVSKSDALNVTKSVVDQGRGLDHPQGRVGQHLILKKDGTITITGKDIRSRGPARSSARRPRT